MGQEILGVTVTCCGSDRVGKSPGGFKFGVEREGWEIGMCGGVVAIGECCGVGML